jgi:hypothetical protein
MYGVQIFSYIYNLCQIAHIPHRTPKFLVMIKVFRRTWTPLCLQSLKYVTQNCFSYSNTSINKKVEHLNMRIFLYPTSIFYSIPQLF